MQFKRGKMPNASIIILFTQWLKFITFVNLQLACKCVFLTIWSGNLCSLYKTMIYTWQQDLSSFRIAALFVHFPSELSQSLQIFLLFLFLSKTPFLMVVDLIMEISYNMALTRIHFFAPFCEIHIQFSKNAAIYIRNWTEAQQVKPLNLNVQSMHIPIEKFLHTSFTLHREIE